MAPATASKDLLNLEQKNPTLSSLESTLLVCGKSSPSQTPKPNTFPGKLVTNSMPKSEGASEFDVTQTPNLKFIHQESYNYTTLSRTDFFDHSVRRLNTFSEFKPPSAFKTPRFLLQLNLFTNKMKNKNNMKNTQEHNDDDDEEPFPPLY